MAASKLPFHSHHHYCLTRLSNSARLNLHPNAASGFAPLVAFQLFFGYLQTFFLVTRPSCRGFAAFHESYGQMATVFSSDLDYYQVANPMPSKNH